MKAAGNTLEQLCEPGRNITYGVVKPGHEFEDGVRFIRGGDVYQGRIAEDVLRTISPQLSEQYKRTILRGGELLVSLVGSPGEVAVVPERLAGANIARQVGVIPLGPQANPNFVMYFLRSPLGRAQLFTRTQGAVQQVINLADVKTIVVPDISLSIQARIASILSAYDDLIENNRRRIQLLEQSAQLLYKEWFVHLRFPGHEHFKTIKGVPDNWEEKPISSFCTVGRGGSPRPINDFLGGTIPWFKIGDATASESLYVFSTAEMIIEDGLKKSVLLQPMELILSNSATCGIPYFTGIEGCIHDGWLFFKQLNRISKWFLYCCLFEKQREILAGIGEGATQKNLNTEYIGRQNVLLPKERGLLAAFDDNVEPLFTQIYTLAQANIKLTKARDLLLPRLMNGEVTV